MAENQPKEYDAVLGGQVPSPVDGVVLGGIEGVKKRLANISFEQRIAALEDALNYGEAGLELLIQTLTDVSPEVQQTAENLLFQHRTKPKVKQALQKYNPWLLFECLQTISGHTHDVNSVVISPDGQTIFSCSVDNTIRLWGLSQRKEIFTLQGHSRGVNSIAIHPDGQILASGSYDETIKFWNVQTRQELRTLTAHSGGVHAIAISPDGHLLGCSITNQRKILVCDLQTRQQLGTLKKPHHGAHSHCLAITPNKQILVDANSSNRIDIWNLETEELIRTLKAHSQSVKSVAISPDGETLVSGCSDNIIKVWVLRTGEEKFTINAHSGTIFCVAISLDGQNLIGSCGDGTIKVWDLQTGRGKAIFNGHTAGVRSVAISADGRTLISGSVDETIKIWRMPQG
ncbi:hypothetical protein A6769_35805 [Nostoc punctiforme NIES-2108]|uniref:Uncharacterized protein n=1 Tax=Nostoc punctiforme NIES-2108 TaxID=1356359 RepID=A0A367QYL4_NOSPU|nr:hypothetical protein A6769_35805 [Nostoc punctiforme NIES-2108]